MRKILFVAATAAMLAQAGLAQGLIEVYKSPSCGCCGKWANIMEQNGFSVKEHMTDAVIEVKTKNNVPLELSSCHTGVIGGYVVEGHVPADDIKRLLEQKPADVIGISVPGMPLGSPGMEQGGIVEDYDVVAFKKDGSYEIFSSYRGGKRVK